MEALLAFHVGFWDYVTFLPFSSLSLPFSAAAVVILGLPAASPSPAEPRG